MSDDINLQELEEQEWVLEADSIQQLIEYEGMNGETMKFAVQDPGTDEMLNIVAVDPGDDADPGQNLYNIVNKAVISPEVTLERWRGMHSADKIGLAEEVSDAIGLNKILGFPADGLEAQLEELQSESPENGDS